MTYTPPLEVIAWHKKRGHFMTCFVAGTIIHPDDPEVFRYPGGHYTRRSTGTYWIDNDKELEDILGKGHYFTASV